VRSFSCRVRFSKHASTMLLSSKAGSALSRYRMRSSSALINLRVTKPPMWQTLHGTSWLLMKLIACATSISLQMLLQT